MIKVTVVENVIIILTKENIRLTKKLRRQDPYFSTRLAYAKKREIWMNMINTTYNTTEDMINNLQSIKGKTKLNFYKNLSIRSDEMNSRNFKFEEDPFSKNAHGISKIYHEVTLLWKFLQTKPQAKNMDHDYNDLYYTVIKSRD